MPRRSINLLYEWDVLKSSYIKYVWRNACYFSKQEFAQLIYYHIHELLFKQEVHVYRRICIQSLTYYSTWQTITKHQTIISSNVLHEATKPVSMLIAFDKSSMKCILSLLYFHIFSNSFGHTYARLVSVHPLLAWNPKQIIFIYLPPWGTGFFLWGEGAGLGTRLLLYVE